LIKDIVNGIVLYKAAVMVKVRQAVAAHSPAQLSVNRFELDAKARQPSADQSSSAFISFL
jgi:hypothetical protein